MFMRRRARYKIFLSDLSTECWWYLCLQGVNGWSDKTEKSLSKSVSSGIVRIIQVLCSVLQWCRCWIRVRHHMNIVSIPWRLTISRTWNTGYWVCSKINIIITYCQVIHWSESNLIKLVWFSCLGDERRLFLWGTIREFWAKILEQDCQFVF